MNAEKSPRLRLCGFPSAADKSWLNRETLSGDVLEFPRPAEVDPLHDIEVAAGIDAEGMRRGKQGGIGLVVGFIGFPVRLLTVAELRDQFPIRV